MVLGLGLEWDYFLGERVLGRSQALIHDKQRCAIATAAGGFPVAEPSPHDSHHETSPTHRNQACSIMSQTFFNLTLFLNILLC